jgi:GTP-binding protein Era
MDQQQSGNIAIVGRPNVGKYTLLNWILGQKGAAEMVFIDTPGWQRHPRRQLNRMMNRQVSQALTEIDVIVMMMDARGWTEDDELLAAHIERHACPRILVLNKHDKVHPKERLLGTIEDLRRYEMFADFIPICARNGGNVPRLLHCIKAILPARPHVFPDDQCAISETNCRTASRCL